MEERIAKGKPPIPLLVQSVGSDVIVQLVFPTGTFMRSYENISDTLQLDVAVAVASSLAPDAS